jgi:hypothetical protein
VWLRLGTRDRAQHALEQLVDRDAFAETVV